MIYRYFSSTKGIAVVKMLLGVVIVGVVVLYFLPHISGDSLTVVNQVGDRVKGIVNNLSSKAGLTKAKVMDSVDSIWTKTTRKLADLLDKWNAKKLSELITGVQEEWKKDMTTLISTSRSRGFNMGEIQQSYDEYEAGERSWRRVESFYWQEMREQTQAAIKKSFTHFLTRPVGCSDFTVELNMIWEIVGSFNDDSYDGYVRAKELSEELYNPRSLDFLTLLLDWFRVAGMYSAPGGNWENDWFVKQLQRALPDAENASIDYPSIINEIDAQVGASSHQIYRILGDITIAEIYLNYDLVNSSLERYEEVLRNVHAITSQYDKAQQYSYTTLGLHMALGLLNERMCSNNDLASKEFKDVIAIARRLNLDCGEYKEAHYHLAIINLHIKDRTSIQPVFEPKENTDPVTAQDLLQPTGTPMPVAEVSGTGTGSTPSYEGGVVTGTVGDGRARALVAVTPQATPVAETEEREERPAAVEDGEDRPVEVDITTPTPIPTLPPTPTPDTPYYAPGEIVKGTIPADAPRRAERDIRLRPRKELGQSMRIQTFTIDQIYDLSRIPEDAVREFEMYLKCNNDGEESKVARYVLDRYLGK